MAWKAWLCTSRNKPRITKANVIAEESSGDGLSLTGTVSASAGTEYGEGSPSQGRSSTHTSDKSPPKQQELSSWESIEGDVETDEKQDSFYLHEGPGAQRQASTQSATNRDHETEGEIVQTGYVIATGLRPPPHSNQASAHCIAQREANRRECVRRRPRAILAESPPPRACGAQKFVNPSQQAGIRTTDGTKRNASGDCGSRGGGVLEVPMMDRLTRSKDKLSSSSMKSNLDRAMDEWLAERNNLKEWKAEFDASLDVDQDEISDLGSVLDDTTPETVDTASRGCSLRPGSHALAVERDFDPSLCTNRGESSEWKEWQVALDAWRQELDEMQIQTAGSLVKGSDQLCSRTEIESSNLWPSNLESRQQLQCNRELEYQYVNEARVCAEQDTNSWQGPPHIRSWWHSEDIQEKDRQRVFEASLCAERERNLEVQRALQSWAELETQKEQEKKAKLETSLCADREKDLQRSLEVWSDRHNREELNAENRVEGRERDLEWQSIAESWRPGGTKSMASVHEIREEESELPSMLESWRKLDSQRELGRAKKFEASLCAQTEKDAEWQMSVDSWRRAERANEAEREGRFETVVCANREGDVDWRFFWEMWLAAEREREKERQRCFETRLGRARHNAWYRFVEAWLSRDSRPP